MERNTSEFVSFERISDLKSVDVDRKSLRELNFRSLMVDSTSIYFLREDL